MNSTRINVNNIHPIHKITIISSKSRITVISSKGSIKKEIIQEHNINHKPHNKIKHYDNNIIKDNYLNLPIAEYNNNYRLNVSTNYISNIYNIIVISSNNKEKVSNIIEYVNTTEHINNKEIKHIIYEGLISKPPSSN